MFTPSSTPNQIRSMPSFSATGPISGTTMNDSSKKSRKNARKKISRFTTIRKPSWPPGRLVSRCSTQLRAVHALEHQAEHCRADQDEHHEAGELGRGVQRLLEQREAEAPRAMAMMHRANRAHRAAFGRRRDAQEDRAEHQEDQQQRRDQHERHAFGDARQQVQPEQLVDAARSGRRRRRRRPSTRRSFRRWARLDLGALHQPTTFA